MGYGPYEWAIGHYGKTSRFATSTVVGSTDVLANFSDVALAATWGLSLENPKMMANTSPVSGEAPARVRRNATPILIGLETPLPSRCWWNPSLRC